MAVSSAAICGEVTKVRSAMLCPIRSTFLLSHSQKSGPMVRVQSGEFA